MAGGGTHATSPDENTPSTNASSTAIISTGGGGAASGQGSGQRRAPSSSTSSLSSHVSSSSSSSSSLSPLSSSFQDAFLSYISSEHCYQKPRALVVEKRSSSGASYMDNGDLHGYDTQGGRHYARQQRPDKASQHKNTPAMTRRGKLRLKHTYTRGADVCVCVCVQLL